MRGGPRWLAVAAVLAVGVAVCAFRIIRAPVRAQLLTQISQDNLAADGFSSAELTIRSSDARGLHNVKVESQNPRQLSVASVRMQGESVTASLQAGVMPGEATVRIIAPGSPPRELFVRVTPSDADAAGDGTPDFLRLHDPADRLAFRQWFTLLAESQYYRDRPQPEIDDCAALLRFAYREALRQHDSEWLKSVALPVPPSAGDIKQYQYPFTPLGPEIFRVHGGRFASGDLRDGAFAQFADAETLWHHNTFSVGRRLALARPGDLLFFRQEAGGMPFHAMVFLGRSQVEPDSQQFVVYHTGPDADSRGVVKRLSIAELLDYPDPRWRPVASNPAFLGVYRWNILRGGD